MAVEWAVVRLLISSPQDFSKIESELADREENGWDLEYVAPTGGKLMMFFKKTVE